MFIQGDLQAVFDALYSIGAIDPILKSDWQQINTEMVAHPQLYNQALQAVNACAGDRGRLVQMLEGLETQAVNFIAVEVARELAEFTDRKELH